MIISFYNEKFVGLQNNASLVVDNPSYSLVRRGVELDELKCTCEAFTEDIQPTFLIVKNDRGKYVYGALAGIPQLNSKNQTEITGTDLKSMLKSDVILDLSQTFANVKVFLEYVFTEWDAQANQGTIPCELVFEEKAAAIGFADLLPTGEANTVKDAWDDIFSVYMKYYGLYMETEIDLIHKKVIFRIDKTMQEQMTVRLWELGIYDYGKWVADVNETQGYVLNKSATENPLKAGYRWILTSKNEITQNPDNRDIYPIKRRVVVKETEDSTEETKLMNEANQEALEKLTESMFNENIEIPNLQATFKTRFDIYVKKGEGLYKQLPCGELHEDANGLKKVQIGYRFTGLQFIL